MIDSIKTFLIAAKTLVENEALKVYIVATHNLLSVESLKALDESPYVHQVLVTNTVPLRLAVKKVVVIDITPTLAEAIRRTHNGESISYLFENVPQ